MPRKLSVGPVRSPSAVWLNTTSRMTSMPARCRALTMSRNSFTGPSGSCRELYAWCGAKNETGW